MKWIAPTIQVDDARRELIIGTTGNGCYGIYKAPIVGRPGDCHRQMTF